MKRSSPAVGVPVGGRVGTCATVHSYHGWRAHTVAGNVMTNGATCASLWGPFSGCPLREAYGGR